mmetsp:Transcript_119/g.379  ORF Transcript_119/g.379 Transcript_119/m.379 type:complete len:205 (+) Transcript_119:1050-1664(+)
MHSVWPPIRTVHTSIHTSSSELLSDPASPVSPASSASCAASYCVTKSTSPQGMSSSSSHVASSSGHPSHSTLYSTVPALMPARPGTTVVPSATILPIKRSMMNSWVESHSHSPCTIHFLPFFCFLPPPSPAGRRRRRPCPQRPSSPDSRSFDLAPNRARMRGWRASTNSERVPVVFRTKVSFSTSFQILSWSESSSFRIFLSAE